MAEPILCPIAPEFAEQLRANPFVFIGACRIHLQDDNVLVFEVDHDCFLMHCQHNGWPVQRDDLAGPVTEVRHTASEPPVQHGDAPGPATHSDGRIAGGDDA